MNKLANIAVWSLLAAVVIGGAWLINQSASRSNTETKEVRIANLPVVHGLPLYVAIEKGYFDQAGLMVEVIKFEAPNQIVDAVMNGQADFSSPSGATGITGIAAHKNPGKIKIYAVAGEGEKTSAHALVVPPDSKLISISELRGKRLGILTGSIQWRTITREILSQNGLDMDKDLTIVELAAGVQVEALATRQVDALLALEPIPTVAVGTGVGKVWINSPARSFIADPFWGGAGIVNTEFAVKNPQVTKKVIQVLGKAINEINANPDNYRSYYKGYTSLTDELIQKVPALSFKTCNQFDAADSSAVKKFFAIFTKYHVVEGEIDVEDLLYCR